MTRELLARLSSGSLIGFVKHAMLTPGGKLQAYL